MTVSNRNLGGPTSANTCTRNDVLHVGASYPAVTVTVRVSSAATSPQVSMASVAGGGGGTVSTADSTIVLPPSGVSLVSVPNPSVFGQVVALTAMVTPSTATGRVTFYAGTAVLGAGSLSAGVASLSSTKLPAGSVKLTAFYGGDSSHGAGASNVVAQSTVTQPGGAFALSGLPNAGADPVSVAVGDFNGDGKADLAVTDFTGGAVGVLLGNGNGTFQAVMNNPVGANPQSVVVGDFNGDGKADLAVTNFYGGNLSVLLGNTRG